MKTECRRGACQQLSTAASQIRSSRKSPEWPGSKCLGRAESVGQAGHGVPQFCGPTNGEDPCTSFPHLGLTVPLRTFKVGLPTLICVP